MVIPAETAIGAVRLDVADPDRVQRFYEQTIGLEEVGRDGDVVSLGAGGAALVELAARPEAPARPPGSTGLFHVAILVPDRLELARALRRLAEARTPLTGASDHLVSEALYLNDPEGNGIEIYRDRPRDEWERSSSGEIAMATLPLDIEGLIDEAASDDEAPAPMPAGARIGHAHLQVSDLAAAEAFYAGALGFDVTVRGYPGALFVAAGGYHHHIGLNTWSTEGAPPPPPGSRGLAWFEVVVASAVDVDGAGEALRGAGFLTEDHGAGLLSADPAGNRVLIKPA